MSDHNAVADNQVEYDAIVIGAGFAGMYMLHKLREQGLTAHVYEGGDGVGGTWYWNRYPGARCDVESMFYSYSFSDELQQEWRWTERYPSQPEILRYANHVADRFDLRKDISLETRVLRVERNEDANQWVISTDTGLRVLAKYVVTAVGCLSASRVPSFEGLGTFLGETYHTGQWPHHEVDFSGKRVAVIGTGSSGIQAIPVIGAQADQLTVFQRTPNFSIPAHNHPLDTRQQDQIKRDYPTLRAAARLSAAGVVMEGTNQNAVDVPQAERQAELDRRWQEGGAAFVGAYNDTVISLEANKISADYVRERIRQTVKDPRTAALLSPHSHPIGTKRICVDTDYYATYNRDNVHLVDISQNPITAITPNGLQVNDEHYEFDTIVFATGYDAMTGPLNRVDIVGTNGDLMKDLWSAGPRSYLGLSVAGFPNLFTITGPGSPSVLSNMMVSIEQHVEWISEYIGYLQENHIGRTEADQAAQDSWVEHVNEVAGYTLYPEAASWYMGANIPGKPRVFMPYLGGVGGYRQTCDEIAQADYKGFVHS